MATAHVSNPQESMQIPCILNRASLGSAEYVFVVLRDLVDEGRKVAWVPRDDVIVEKQPLSGRELRGQLAVRVKEVNSHNCLVTFMNGGVEETVGVAKPE